MNLWRLGVEQSRLFLSSRRARVQAPDRLSTQVTSTQAAVTPLQSTVKLIIPCSLLAGGRNSPIRFPPPLLLHQRTFLKGRRVAKTTGEKYSGWKQDVSL